MEGKIGLLTSLTVYGVCVVVGGADGMHPPTLIHLLHQSKTLQISKDSYHCEAKNPS